MNFESSKKIRQAEEYFPFHSARIFSDGYSICQYNENKLGETPTLVIIDKIGGVTYMSNEFKNIDDCKCGLFRVEKKNGTYNYINFYGEVQYDEEYLSATSFHNNYAIVMDKNSHKKIINKWGDVVFENKNYDEISLPDLKDRFIVRKKQKYGIKKIDYHKMVLSCEYDDLNNFEKVDGNDIAIVGILAKNLPQVKYGILNFKGHYQTDIMFDVIEPYSRGLASAKYFGKFGFIDSNGLVKIDFEFDDAKSFNKEDHAIVTHNGIDKIIDKKGNFLFEAVSHSLRILQKNNQNLICQDNKKIGVLNLNHKTIIPFCYDGIKKITEKIYLCIRNKQFCLIDITNQNECVDYYDQIIHSGDRIMVKISNKKWYLFDTNLNQLKLKIKIGD